MKLLSFKLSGQYKGLKDQSFDFSHAQGNIIALIGLNGSGKSQLLEVIAESFAFLERFKRDDFLVKTSLRFGFELVYQLDENTNHNIGSAGMQCGGITAVVGGVSNPKFKVTLDAGSKEPTMSIFYPNSWSIISSKVLELPYVVGYSSGQNENLQRSFMKNAVQYFEIQRLRLKHRKQMSGKLESSERAKINQSYLDKYPHIFSTSAADEFEVGNSLSLKEAATPISKSVYLDYDSAGLIVASLAIIPHDEINYLLNEVTFKYPTKVVLRYDFLGGVTEEDAIKDVKMFMDIAGVQNVHSIGQKTTDEQYEVYSLDYLAGEIVLDLTDDSVLSELRERNYRDPFTLFQRLYKLQQLGVKNWQYASRLSLKKDDFIGTVKKPLKTKLPILVSELILSDGNGRSVCMDDLSDGEAQLIEILATSRIFSSKDTLFLYDEPETHLNPSWRTYFHSHLSKAIAPKEDGETQSQVFLSTHSPFMVSSLKKENVLFFNRDDEGVIHMGPVDSQTYGASFEVLIKQHFGLKSLISQTVVEAVKEYLSQHSGPEEEALTIEWIKGNLGDSMEKAYLLRKLQS
ncbi:putative AbiEii toxin of type IV toxin-antitoxin system [Marinomonas alcarazii]|uniref:Putative AbiEii toxin of type IV toxin-antitoxin system n=1 Tax=Marinomonas alcarazii TaxID=491949 RepID=A0A318UWS1_9GAMM|nr:AAA family ATPase [Marinomonas alcarazii]PYF79900.1 putative AbiEii toxin of type IV toxin-antitoxin system [Marinomonas alcarazii]